MKWRAPVSSSFYCCQLTAHVGLTGFLEVGERLQTPDELSHPMSSPSSCSLMSGGCLASAHCLTHRTITGKLSGLSNHHTPSVPKLGTATLVTEVPHKAAIAVKEILSETRTAMLNSIGSDTEFIWKSNTHLEILTQKVVHPFILLVFPFFIIYQHPPHLLPAH